MLKVWKVPILKKEYLQRQFINDRFYHAITVYRRNNYIYIYIYLYFEKN